MTDRPVATTPDEPIVAADEEMTSLTVLFWGTYDVGKPRTRILRDGLREIGVEVVEIHADIWAGHLDKSQSGRYQLFKVALHAFWAYPILIWRYLRAPHHDVVIIPYLGQIDVLVLWLFARLKRRMLVWDMFISIYDTVVFDRQIAGQESVTARGLKILEWVGCRAANLVLTDTPTHGRRISKLFGISSERIEAVPVGAELVVFANVPERKPHDGPVRILFYGQLIPLHGVKTILDAALSERGHRYDWLLIGTGQNSDLLCTALTVGKVSHIVWEKWRDYDELRTAIREADICLGIFGSSEKAASVIPNKVYQSLVAGRSVVTRRSPAMEEAFVRHPGLELVPHSDPEALLDGIERIVEANFPTLPQHHLKAVRPSEIARLLIERITLLINKGNLNAN